jgi:hypothetical protein
LRTLGGAPSRERRPQGAPICGWSHSSSAPAKIATGNNGRKERFMRRFVLSLAVSLIMASAGHAQEKSTLVPAFSPGAGQLRGVYAPPQSAAPTSLPTTITGPSSSVSDNVPNVTMPGDAQIGQALPDGVAASPMVDRPGYGRAIVNGHNAIVDTNSNQIVQFSD